ncbi:hypothetical protein AB0D27_09150 [Streptomyces sp. NPDC048415]|uniref:hypothetical protein n=1 Tax=Streptomyces sp. NPDC048415 TaxID=3154822 RepID=UPI003414BC8B
MPRPFRFGVNLLSPSPADEWSANCHRGLTAGSLGRPGSKRYRRAVEKRVVFRPEGAQPYDDRMLSWQIAERQISI